MSNKWFKKNIPNVDLSILRISTVFFAMPHWDEVLSHLAAKSLKQIGEVDIGLQMLIHARKAVLKGNQIILWLLVEELLPCQLGF